MGSFLRKRELAQTSTEKWTSNLQCHANSVNGEFNPLPQTGDSDNSSERLKDFPRPAPVTNRMDRRQFLSTHSFFTFFLYGMEAAFVALNECWGRSSMSTAKRPSLKPPPAGKRDFAGQLSSTDQVIRAGRLQRRGNSRLAKYAGSMGTPRG